MTSITHAFVSGIADGGDPTLVQPGDWNAEHVIEGGDPVGWEAMVYAGGAPYSITDGVTASGTAVGLAYQVPVRLTTRMYLQSVSIWNTDTASARSWEWALYRDDDAASAVRVAISNGSDAFTASAASTRTLAATSAPVLLLPGTYWLLLRNSHGSNTFGFGFVIAASNFTLSAQRSKTVTLTDPLDLSSGWGSATANMPIAVLRGRVLGESVAWT